MRKNYIDNLRWTLVLLLFPFHVFMIYNNWGENFYIKQNGLFLPSLFNTVIWPWFMPSLFLLSGISAFYSLGNRGIKGFIIERITKLFIPLFFGILLLIPVQTYYAERFHNGYEGNYFAQYKLFFTKINDLTGYSGGFTPGHLWFILYLFVISMMTIPVIQITKRIKLKERKSIPFGSIILLGFLPLLGKLILNIGGKSIIEYLIYYLLGYYLLRNDGVIDKIEKELFLLSIAAFLLMICFILLNGKKFYEINNILYFCVYQMYSWTFILFIFGIYKRKRDFKNKITEYLSKSSFSVYLFHQSGIIFCAYYIIRLRCSVQLHITCILISSIILTFCVYVIARPIKVFRIIFAIKR